MNPDDYEEQWTGPKQYKKKKTKKWCKGKVGREHVPVIEFNKAYSHITSKSEKPCGERNWYPGYFMCYHHVVCDNCGKELNFYPDVCPDAGVKPGEF